MYLCVSTGLSRGQVMEEPACVGASLSQCPAPAVSAGEAQLGGHAGSGTISGPLYASG